MTIDAIPLEVRPYLLEISERLWTGHASIMIGAGFSKNAKKVASVTADLPSWAELGDIFYEKIYGSKPTSDRKYLNALKLADEVQAAFGRSVLDQLLKKHIADKDYEPSDIHIQLLELPWSDIFTTNYDTLLERSCENVISRRYDVVINQEDIIYSKRPRIIKLHGSFPSERPLIITEEDYRTYPKKFAPFVNTVQQSLLENTLCLVGFSGDDPNFLQWIGWINDNIGKENSPKIYLIGILNLSDAQKKLLATKNIVSVDLSFIGDRNNHAHAITQFIEFLQSTRKTRRNLQWPNNPVYHHYDRDRFDVLTLINDWNADRDSYPNWIVLPREQRDILWQHTSEFAWNDQIIPDIELLNDLQYVFELNWRLERCLFPIYNNVAFQFQDVLNRYNPFPKELPDTSGVNPDDAQYAQLNWAEIQERWLTISVSLLRFYREENFVEQWDNVLGKLLKLKNMLSPELSSAMHYERCLMSLTRMDFDTAKQILNEWSALNATPYWQAKRASIVAECGDLKMAESSMEECLTTIRKRLNLSPIESDYGWVSQEAYVMFLLQIIRFNIRIQNNIYDRDDEAEIFSERWNNLLQYKCDPWQEKKLFELSLNGKYTKKEYRTKNMEFAIGRITSTFSIGGDSSDAYNAYSFLRFVEEIGLPLGLPNNVDAKTISSALERIIDYSPSWAIAVGNRSRHDKVSASVFNREYLAKTTVEDNDRLMRLYLARLDSIISGDEGAPKAYAEKIILALSRLCTKCSSELREACFAMYIKLDAIRYMKGETSKLFRMLIDSTSSQLLEARIPELLALPIYTDIRDTHHFPEPFDFPEITNLKKQISVTDEQIHGLIDFAASNGKERPNAVKRLIFLYRNGGLLENQTATIFEAIWKHVGEDGFPTNTTFYNFALSKWPTPEDVDASLLYEKYILNGNFDIQHYKTEKGISVNGGFDRFAAELRYGSKSINNLDGRQWELNELGTILSKCEEWWNLDKKYVQEEQYFHDRLGGSIAEEFAYRFSNIVEIISRVFSEQLSAKPSEEIVQRIVQLITSMEDHVPVLRAKVPFYQRFYANPNLLIDAIQEAMATDDEQVNYDGFTAATMCFHFITDNAVLDNVINLLFQPTKWKLFQVYDRVFQTLINLFEEREDTRPRIIPILLSMLEQLRDVNSNQGSNNPLSYSELLPLLRYVAHASSILHTHYFANETDAPEVIRYWKSFNVDSNQFADITNRWKNDDLPMS